MEKKVYKNPAPLSIEVENLNNELRVLKAKPMSPSLMKQLEDVMREKGITATGLVVKQMVMIFGEDETYYDQFDFPLMNEILTDLTDEVKKKMIGEVVPKSTSD